MELTGKCQKLAEIYRRKREDGLVDVKFYVRHTDEASLEEVCAEAVNLEEAIERGEGVPFTLR